jgi:hypothetical protein
MAPSPFCARLRTKGYYFLDRPARTEEELLDGSGRCWCQHTQDSIGPDGELVDTEDCLAGRGCWEPLGPSA